MKNRDAYIGILRSFDCVDNWAIVKRIGVIELFMEASLSGCTVLIRIRARMQRMMCLFCHSFDDQTCMVKIRTGLDKRPSSGSTDLSRTDIVAFFRSRGANYWRDVFYGCLMTDEDLWLVKSQLAERLFTTHSGDALFIFLNNKKTIINKLKYFEFYFGLLSALKSFDTFLDTP